MDILRILAYPNLLGIKGYVVVVVGYIEDNIKLAT